MVKLSPFAHAITFGDEDVIVLNVFTGATGVATRDQWNKVVADISNSELLPSLHDMGLVVGDGETIATLYRQHRQDGSERQSAKFIFETGLGCNLACTYCYQSDYRQNSRPSYDVKRAVESLTSLARDRFPNLTTINASFIGGEPLLNRTFISEIRDALRMSAGDLNIKFVIDTNATLLEESDIAQYDQIGMALTLPADHDRFRVYPSGRGSSEEAWQRLRDLSEVFNASSTLLELRYNAHRGNVADFAEFLEEVQLLGIQRVSVRAFPVVNYEGNPTVEPLALGECAPLNQMAMEWELATGRSITTFPLPWIGNCSAYDLASIKLHSDGSVSTCNAHVPFGRVSLDDVPQLPLLNEAYPELGMFDPLSDTECCACKWLPLCGGKTMCKSRGAGGEISNCDFLDYDLDAFLRFFVENYPEHPNQFVRIS